MMNEEKILLQIKRECSLHVSDSSERIQRDIADMSDRNRAEVIHTDNSRRYSSLKYIAAAAAVFLPLVLTANMFFNRSSEDDGNNDEFNLAAVSETSFTRVSDTQAEITAEVSHEVTVTSAVSSETQVTVPAVQVPETTSVTVSVSEYIYTEPVVTEDIPEHSETPAETKAAETTASVPETTQTEPSVTEDVPSAPESFRSEYKLVPGSTDRIYCLEFNAEKADGQKKVYSTAEKDYTVASPDAYTVCVYDVIVYDFDYFDFLSTGDYLLRKEYKYTIDEILSSDEKLLTVEDLVSSGLITE